MYKNAFKRVFDFFIALLILVFFLPIMLVVILISAFVTKENPFFFQKRPGLNEHVFKIMKLKTMNNKTDTNGNLLPDSDRLTKWGVFLRKTSLDEIPQLINVLKGDMSLVGPRPLMVKYLPYYTEIEKLRHTVRPGITGLAQVNGRNNLSWNEKLNLDVEYVNNISFILDLKILFNTAYSTLTSKDIVVDSYLVEPDLDELRKNNF